LRVVEFPLTPQTPYSNSHGVENWFGWVVAVAAFFLFGFFFLS
jgi:hypothetical protein